MKDKILLSPPHMTGEEEAMVAETIASNWIAPLGPQVDAFERELANMVWKKGGAAMSSGTAAIHLALKLVNVRPGDLVFCSSLTFVASANPVLYEKAIPVFIDSEPDTWNMSPVALEKALMEAKRQGALPKAVIVVNLYGQSAKMAELAELCDAYRVPMIEDAAESLGSSYQGRPSGSFGKFGIYSFNGNKIITTSGGGMLVSDDLDALERARFLASQARDQAAHYEHSQIGYNYRMSNVLAAIGRVQLASLHEKVQARRAIFERYSNAFRSIPGLTMMPQLAGTRSNRWLTTFTLAPSTGSSSEVLAQLNAANIEARPVWKPLHLQPLFRDAAFFSHDDTRSPISEGLFATGICLPSGSSLTHEQQLRVIRTIRHAVAPKRSVL
ncbi:DegT/DnrJ/EryC1/StrS family aminotransferase [Aureibacillus halotolerans]|uniref:Pyridoxal phosphate-dependent aminotransferase EpsN n=1 Tax=Aureibacillus halotolerans TaxID=1508390 RepID=A0A4R6U2K6_9BACI|nr:aminotransferase class I/II-fold pyridoxal phosphate-dependent enzyme [Aureibacillus halotolerans]TDQ38669.1 pyridoxal phosphate-dependent aminotransferase EpsN [Aureibacillus halotolerans]